MKKITYIFAALMIVASIGSTATAQLTTGSSTATSIRTGNRASDGDFGLYFGASLKYFDKVFVPGNGIKLLPVVNLKYMYSDNMELRLGLEIFKYNESLSGKAMDDSNLSQSVTNTSTAIYPGFAYHFAKNNILDVYAGAELPLGYERFNYTDKLGDYYDITSRFNYRVGLGGFIGLQAYLANLPIAVGFEYGYYGELKLGMQYKNVSKANAASDEVVQYSSTNIFNGAGADNSTAQFAYVNGVGKNLSGSTNTIGNEFRVTITYFFHK